MALETLRIVLFLLLTGGLAWFDIRTRRVPNRVTHLLIAAGFLLHFPSTAPVWAASLGLFWGSRFGILGGGDAKLWLAILWFTPPALASDAVLMMAFAFAGTGALQLVWRRLHRKPVFGIRAPGAWRVLPFALWLVVVG